MPVSRGEQYGFHCVGPHGDPASSCVANGAFWAVEIAIDLIQASDDTQSAVSCRGASWSSRTGFSDLCRDSMGRWGSVAFGAESTGVIARWDAGRKRARPRCVGSPSDEERNLRCIDQRTHERELVRLGDSDCRRPVTAGNEGVERSCIRIANALASGLRRRTNARQESPSPQDHPGRGEGSRPTCPPRESA